jgi:clathrin heavy chain
MMAHDAVAWDHIRFKDIAVKCSTVDIFYKAVQHYFDMHPALVTDLLKVLEGRVDHNRVVALVRRGGYLGASKDYLIAVQKNNLVSVNEAVNEVLIEEDDFEGLEASVESYDNFDQLKLAEDLEVRPLLFNSMLLWHNSMMLCWENNVHLERSWMDTAPWNVAMHRYGVCGCAGRVITNQTFWADDGLTVERCKHLPWHY